LIALPEEILFRGIVAKNIQQYFSNIYITIILSALIFGMAHLLNGAKSFWPKNWNWKLTAMTFVAGIFLCLIYLMTNSLTIPIILHSLLILINKIFIKD
jgi:membrane protease YdiL (CAAX protease family)